MQRKLFNWLIASLTLLSAEICLAEQDLAAEYRLRCSYCHDTAFGTAPRWGVEYDWVERLQFGKQSIALRSLAGYRRMPAKGGNLDLSDEQYLALANYLIGSVEKK